MNSEEKNNNGISRRQFSKAITGMGLAAMGAALESPFALAADQENKIQKERAKHISIMDNKPYEIDEKIYKRFSGANIAFNAVSRDVGAPWMKPYLKNLISNLMKGNTSREIDVGSVAAARSYLAVTTGLKTVNNIIGPYGEGHENVGFLSWNDLHTPPPLRPGARKPDLIDPVQLTTQAKLMARMVGADLVGVCRVDRRWIYSDSQRNTYSNATPQTKTINFKKVPKPLETESELIIPDSVKYAIVMAVAMNRPMIQTSPAMVSSGGTNLGYSRMGFASVSLAEYIRTLGYVALPCMNDTGLSVPMAVDGGLGELGRNGILITPEFGPCVRLCKVLTNMPLIPDKPINFGVEEFCNNCKKCARECPSKCITEANKTWEARNECNNPGIKKWYNDYKKCLTYWIENGSSCTNCISVCPFTKGALWAHDATKLAIDKARFMDGVWLGLDDAFGYGKRRDSKEIWSMKTGTYGIDPDQFQKNKA
jgi:tetrachloroethene reductive dehalogenase